MGLLKGLNLPQPGATDNAASTSPTSPFIAATEQEATPAPADRSRRAIRPILRKRGRVNEYSSRHMVRARADRAKYGLEVGGDFALRWLGDRGPGRKHHGDPHADHA